MTKITITPSPKNLRHAIVYPWWGHQNYEAYLDEDVKPSRETPAMGILPAVEDVWLPQNSFITLIGKLNREFECVESLVLFPDCAKIIWKNGETKIVERHTVQTPHGEQRLYHWITEDALLVRD